MGWASIFTHGAAEAAEHAGARVLTGGARGAEVAGGRSMNSLFTHSGAHTASSATAAAERDALHSTVAPVTHVPTPPVVPRRGVTSAVADGAKFVVETGAKNAKGIAGAGLAVATYVSVNNLLHNVEENASKVFHDGVDDMGKLGTKAKEGLSAIEKAGMDKFRNAESAILGQSAITYVLLAGLGVFVLYEGYRFSRFI